jgi:drug/metabolite transporter (DMT)-like permease
VTERQDPYGPYVALTAVQFCFGSLPVVGKVVLRTVPALSVVGSRVGITAFLLIVIQIVRRRFWLKQRSDYWRLAALSLFGVTFNQLLFVTGLSLTKAANSSLLASTIPIFALTVGAIIGTEKLRPVKIGGIILALAGVLLIIDPRNASFSSASTLGDILIVVNSLSFGIYVATSKAVITRNGAFRSMMWVFIFGAIVCVPVGGWSLSMIDIGSLDGVTLLLLLYLAVVSTTTPYLLNAWALARVDPSTVAVFIYLQPLIGFLFAVAFLGEKLDIRFLIAAALIFAGVFLVSKKFVPIET